MNAHSVRKLLDHECQKAGSLRKWAEANELSAGYVSRVLRGEKELGDEIPIALGLERIVTYRKRKQANGRAK